MIKNLLAVTFAAVLSFPSIANSDIKITGQIQLEVIDTSDGPNGNGITLDDASEAGNTGSGSASAIGLSGTHMLGNGMTGLFKLNFSFQADDTDDGLTDRDQFLGLKGRFGTVFLGRLNSPYKSSTINYDPFLATFMQARGSNGMSAIGHNGYTDEAIAYATLYHSTKVIAAISLDEPTATDDNGEHLIAISATTPLTRTLELALGYLDDTSLEQATAAKVGLKYKSGNLIVASHYEVLNAGLGDQSNIFLTFTRGIGNGISISASFGSQSDETITENNGKYIAIGYKKSFNQKVSIHFGFVNMDEGQVGEGNEVSQIGGGVRVNF